MEDFTLELTDADAEFIQEHDLDVQALFEAKLEEKRAMIARKNPEAKIDDEVLAKLSKLIESYEERGRMQAFQTRVHEQSPVSILASTDGNSIEVAVRARVNNIEYSDAEALSEAGEFLETIDEEIRTFLSDAGFDSVVFKKDGENPPDYDGDIHRVKFTATLD